MNMKPLVFVALVAALFAVGCSQKEQDDAQQAADSKTAEAVTAQQQAAIDAVDKPNPDAINVDSETAIPDTATATH